ncbi:MlaD family protein [Aestuariibius sp. 2305UL40-4]|uniref:MlaD family protein n=1 Tax=Aestuariibius violaceus TaxID=3234132 RepID=UPI00345EE99D
METRANYLLIGIFTLAGFLGLLGFFLWFARVELDRQFAYYDVLFTSVSGLSDASEIRFSGLPVGQVVDVTLDPEQSGGILVRLEVDATTPVRTSSIATIETLGVTGVSFVGISSGDPRDPLLADASDDPIPTIEAGRSTIQVLTEDAPEILNDVLDLTRSLSEVFGPVNQERVTAILANVEASSASFEQAMQDFSTVSETIATATSDIRVFTDRLASISETVTDTLTAADRTLAEIGDLAMRAETTLDVGDAALESGRQALDRVAVFVDEDLSRAVEDFDQTMIALREQTTRIGDDASATLNEFRQTGQVATERLRQIEETIVTTDQMLADVSAASSAVLSAATEIDTLIAGDGTALVQETRQLITNAGRVVDAAATVAEEDLPAILTDIRSATERAAQAIDTVSTDLSAAAGRADEITENLSSTLQMVSTTFENANDTLGRINSALETGDAALSAAEGAFTSADRVLNDEIGEMVTSLQATFARLEEAIGSVSDDIPAITGELRQTTERANSAFAQLESTTAQLGPPLRTFAAEGLPQYSRLALETRTLVANLETLVRRIERDPARYFLGRQEPTYRR